MRYSNVIKIRILVFAIFCLLVTIIDNGCAYIGYQNVNASLEPTQTIDQIILMLSSENPESRAFAADNAGNCFDNPEKERLKEPLIKALEDNDDRVRMFAAQSLRSLDIYDPKIIIILTNWLKEEGHSDDELVQGIQTLGMYNKQANGAFPDLIKILMIKNPGYPSPMWQQIRSATMTTLTAIDNSAAVPYLLIICNDSDELGWLRKKASESLINIGSKETCNMS
jgi:HEAT repeat protein